MLLRSVDVVDDISPAHFTQSYYHSRKPLIIRNLARQWPAFSKWTWDYFKQVAGDKKLGIYNNIKSDAYTPINKADDYTTFGEYIDMIRNGPAEWRVFFFNIFAHSPQLKKDFTWPEQYVQGFLKSVPSLFAGGQGSITHMHFDIDLPNILHTQFLGKKRVLLFPNKEQYKLYRKPFEVLSLADFSHYYDPHKSKIDREKFPAVELAEGYEVIMDHGDTLFMPSGYWHHMEYLESGFALISCFGLYGIWKTERCVECNRDAQYRYADEENNAHEMVRLETEKNIWRRAEGNECAINQCSK